MNVDLEVFGTRPSAQDASARQDWHQQTAHENLSVTGGRWTGPQSHERRRAAQIRKVAARRAWAKQDAALIRQNCVGGSGRRRDGVEGGEEGGIDRREATDGAPRRERSGTALDANGDGNAERGTVE